jgi:endonuclease-3
VTRRELAEEVVDRLSQVYPEPRTLLEYHSPFQLLIAVVLSAQTTDAQVNRVSPRLFAAYPTPGELAAAEPAEVEEIIRPVGFYRNKTKSIIAAAGAIHRDFADQVPTEMDDLLTIPGVGRKSANVLRSALYGLPAIIVDTHFTRVTRRIGLTEEREASAIERDLETVVPRSIRTRLSMAVNFHGRDTCTARSPRCEECTLLDICDYGMLHIEPRNADAYIEGS